jgi:hypothetical protein
VDFFLLQVKSKKILTTVGIVIMAKKSNAKYATYASDTLEKRSSQKIIYEYRSMIVQQTAINIVIQN